MPDDAGVRRDYTVGSVARALRLIEVIADGPEEGSALTQIAEAVGVSKSSAYALIRTLVEAGYLRDVQPGPRYQLGITLVRLGDRAASGYPVTTAVRPMLHELSRRTNMTARAAINDDGHPVFIARVDAPGAVRFHTPLGVRELPHASASGKAILAQLGDGDLERVIGETGMPVRTRKTITDLDVFRRELEITRERGYAIDDEEDQNGVFCVAVPVFHRDGSVFGALSVTGIKFDTSIHRVAELAAMQRKYASQLTELVM